MTDGPPDPIFTGLRRARLARGLTIRAVGTALGYGTSTIGMWETGVRRGTVDQARRYAELLGLDLALVAPTDPHAPALAAPSHGS